MIVKEQSQAGLSSDVFGHAYSAPQKVDGSLYEQWRQTDKFGSIVYDECWLGPNNALYGTGDIMAFAGFHRHSDLGIAKARTQHIARFGEAQECELEGTPYLLVRVHPIKRQWVGGTCLCSVYISVDDWNVWIEPSTRTSPCWSG